MTGRRIAFFTLLALSAHAALAQREAVIDVHLHSYTEVPPEPFTISTRRAEARALTAASRAEELLQETLAGVDRYNV